MSRWVVPAIASAMIIGGIAAAVVAAPREVSFGWFAYAPLSEATFSPDGLIVLAGGALGGLIVAVVGVALLAFWAGYVVRAARERSLE